jgi:hypothetical protein
MMELFFLKEKFGYLRREMKRVRCKRWQSDIIQFAEGTLEKEQQCEVEKHLLKCIRCQQSFQQLQASHQMFLDYTPPELKITLDVWPKLQAKIAKTSAGRQILPKWLKEAWLEPSVRIAASVCLTIAIFGAALMGYRTFQNWTADYVALPASYILDNVMSTSAEEDFRTEGFILPDAGMFNKQKETFLIEDALVISDKPKHLTF